MEDYDKLKADFDRIEVKNKDKATREVLEKAGEIIAAHYKEVERLTKGLQRIADDEFGMDDITYPVLAQEILDKEED